MRIAFFDCFSGISGDMTLGALVDAGLDFDELKAELQKLPVHDEFHLERSRVQKHSISATKIDVVCDDALSASTGHDHGHSHDHLHTHEDYSRTHSHKHPHRHLKDVLRIVDSSQIDAACKGKAVQIFERIAQAEAKVHGTTPDKVHLHEVSAIDSIVDIVGAVIGLHKLGVERIYSSPVVVGSGTVQCEHGTMPVPVPAVTELLRDYPMEIGEVKGELCTPTGAAILSTLSAGVKHNLKLTTQTIGYGAGSKDFERIPNLLRILIGEEFGETDQDEVWIVESSIDNMNPELYPYLMEKLAGQGVIDSYLTPVIMKKGRPGIVLTALCEETRIETLIEMIYQETTTIGVRAYPVRRKKLLREIIELDTPLGRMKVKMITVNGKKKLSPEFEECKRVATERHVPIQEVYRLINQIELT